MSYIKLQHTRSQHTVPKCFLKNFSENGVSLFRKLKKVYHSDSAIENEINSPVPLKSATVEEDFYTVKKGREPMLVETLIYARTIENHYPKIYQMLIDPTIDRFDMLERTNMLSFFLSLHCRTPKQFKVFYNTIPSEYNNELDKIKEDYKVAHLLKVKTALMEAHQFKRVKIAKISDTSEFITSDNPVIILGKDSTLKNWNYKEQFNRDNIILIPIDRKHCFVLVQALDKNGVDLYGKGFYNKIERYKVDVTFTQEVNYLMLGSADKYYFGSKKYLKAMFQFYRLIE